MDSREERSRGGPPRTAQIPWVMAAVISKDVTNPIYSRLPWRKSWEDTLIATKGEKGEGEGEGMLLIKHNLAGRNAWEFFSNQPLKEVR